MLRSSCAAGAARRLALLALFVAVARCADPAAELQRPKHGSPVVREIVADLDVALANELAAIGVSRVLVLSKHAGCPQKIAALVSLKVDARCIPSIEEARTFLHAHEHSNDPSKRENAIAVMVDEDYKVMPMFFWLSHRRQMQLLVTYGEISQATGQVGRLSGALPLSASQAAAVARLLCGLQPTAASLPAAQPRRPAARRRARSAPHSSPSPAWTATLPRSSSSPRPSSATPSTRST
jgi:hypothetical protein